jgi:hypothetical protein
MGLLQRWLDEPDATIARFAKAFYVLTYAFMAVLAYQLGSLALRGDDALVARDVVGPMVSLVLMLVMHLLALDGRRSYKALRQRGSASNPGARTTEDSLAER